MTQAPYQPQPTYQPPQYPTYPQQAPTAYQPPQYPTYPQQPQYAPPAAPPATPPAPGTLDSFFSQPSTGGGKSLSFNQLGQSYIGIVTRPIIDGDIQQQTDTQGRPLSFKDGRPKFVMLVPLQMQPSPEYPDGLARWYVKGQARDELVRAMAEAGAPEGPPEHGAVIQITFTGQRPSGPGMNPAKTFQIVYRRPQNAAPTPPASTPPVTDPLPPAPPAPVPQPPAPDPYLPAAQQPQYAAPVPAQAQPPAPAPATPPPPAELTDEQKALLAQLTGGQG